MTTEQCYNDFLKKLSSIYDSREATNIIDWIFENATGLKRWERASNKSVEIEEDIIQKLDKYLYGLLQHKPVQYVLREAWFYKMKFYVDEHVLIPRPETEELVEWVVEDARNSKNNAQNGELKILDVGTGSGCIAISIKKELTNSDVTGIDVSVDALKVANRNADALYSKISFLEIDFLNEILWNSLSVYDAIVSNPPYIPENEKDKLARNVTAFEPVIALFVENNNPFLFYDKIARFAQSHVKPGGSIYVEIHEEFSKELQEIFLVCDFSTEVRKDIYGKERMIKATSLQSD
jgi:release factor glutamine methyltransferase